VSAQPKTSGEQIRQAVRQLLEDGGVENISMQSVASAVGIQAPSMLSSSHNKWRPARRGFNNRRQQSRGLGETVYNERFGRKSGSMNCKGNFEVIEPQFFLTPLEPASICFLSGD